MIRQPLPPEADPRRPRVRSGDDQEEPTLEEFEETIDEVAREDEPAPRPDEAGEDPELLHEIRAFEDLIEEPARDDG
jgi:negative regulator of genetic competence, sporulation and motility